MASKYGVGSFQTLEEAIEQHDLDAVWIAAPTPFHKDIIKLAAANGIAYVPTILVAEYVAFDGG